MCVISIPINSGQIEGGDNNTTDPITGLLNTPLLAAGTDQANQVGNASVKYRQLYAPEVQAIVKQAPAYAKLNGISEASAEKTLADNLRYYVDKSFQDKAKANGFVPDDNALQFVAKSLKGDNYATPSDIPVADPHYTSQDIVNGLKNYGENYSASFNDRTLGGAPLVGPLVLKSSGDKEVRDFYDKVYYPIHASAEDIAQQSAGRDAGILKEAKQTANDVKDGVVNSVKHPIDTSRQVAAGIQQELEAIKDPLQYIADKAQPTIDSAVESNLDARAGDFYESGVHQGLSIVKGATLGVETAATLTSVGKGLSEVAKNAARKGEVKGAETSQKSATNLADLDKPDTTTKLPDMKGGSAQSALEGKASSGTINGRSVALNSASDWVRPKDWRLPATKGEWQGTPGNSAWLSQKESVNAITGGKPIPFKEGYPDFSEWSQGTFKFDNLTGKNSDFSVVYEAVAKEYGLANKTQAKNFLREVGLTPHHYQDGKTIQLIPSTLHNEIPHIGGASKLRNGR